MISQEISYGVTPAKAGVQTLSPRKRGAIKENLDSGFRRNDEFYGIAAFYEIISIYLLLTAKGVTDMLQIRKKIETRKG
ncbi:MAG: hypothetical protein FJ117_06885 [Deltaproteobacteria bacterium]|nr:hypothetical protein [Deltaproteobacteria bacterium]